MKKQIKSDLIINKDINSLYVRRLKNLMSDKKITYEVLSEITGMTREGLFRSIKKNTLKVNTLIEIADFLNVPVTYFFDEKEGEYERPDVDKVMKVLSDLIKERI